MLNGAEAATASDGAHGHALDPFGSKPDLVVQTAAMGTWGPGPKARAVLPAIIAVIVLGACRSNRSGDSSRASEGTPAEGASVDKSPAFKVGDNCVWKGQGLARIESIENEGGEEVPHLVIVGSGMKVGISAANADRAIRRVLDRDTAAGLWAELKKPAEADTRTWEDRYFDYARTLVKGTTQDQVFRLRRMYSSPFKPTFGERKLIDTYEELLFSELGHVLGRTTEDLRTEMKSLHPVFLPTAGRAAFRTEAS
jgi:RNA polymerase-interacting CarD/CdnL/TRCF family regulator